MSAAPKTPVRPPEWHPDIPDPDECRARLERLQPRQREVLELLGCGWSKKQVAQRLGITYKTVENHMMMAFDSLELRPTWAVLALLRRASEPVELAS